MQLNVHVATFLSARTRRRCVALTMQYSLPVWVECPDLLVL